MYRIGLSVFRGIICGIGMLGCASAQPPDNNLEPSPCIADAEIQVTASRFQIMLGQSSVVSWSVGLPNGCASVRVQLNGENVARSGSKTVNPPRSSTYTLTISQMQSHRRAHLSETVRIVVNYPDRIIIDASTREPVQVLIGALGSNPVVIELCNVDLDLTGQYLEIGDNTTLIASPACARGPRNLGPRIFVRDKRGADNSLFVIRGDNVLFSGFRLEGPTTNIGSAESNRERGIKILPFECVNLAGCTGDDCCQAVPIRNIEISNMEIFHWSGAGIEVMDNTKKAERGRLFNTNVGAVRIHNNYFHHNRHYDGYGYGVAVTNGAYALIERNVFDENRHGIMGGSSDDKKDFSGYTARENLILAGGGKHCKSGFPSFNLICWQTHQIDMHGNKSKRFLGGGCCGIAGETIIIERNTILYVAGDAIKIRGNPADKAVVDGNVFTHNSKGEAISQNGDPDWSGLGGGSGNITNPINVRPNNVFKVLPLSDVGKCDFVGDGNQDTFAATGVTWWAWSPVTQQWRYLNTMSEKLPQLQLGNVDNVGKCDVAARPSNPVISPRKYSKNGMGPWVPVQVFER